MEETKRKTNFGHNREKYLSMWDEDTICVRECLFIQESMWKSKKLAFFYSQADTKWKETQTSPKSLFLFPLPLLVASYLHVWQILYHLEEEYSSDDQRYRVWKILLQWGVCRVGKWFYWRRAGTIPENEVKISWHFKKLYQFKNLILKSNWQNECMKRGSSVLMEQILLDRYSQLS